MRAHYYYTAVCFFFVLTVYNMITCILNWFLYPEQSVEKYFIFKQFSEIKRNFSSMQSKLSQKILFIYNLQFDTYNGFIVQMKLQKMYFLHLAMNCARERSTLNLSILYSRFSNNNLEAISVKILFLRLFLSDCNSIKRNK